MNNEILRMEQICAWSNAKPILRSARFTLLAGEIVGVVGMNYSGKSALMGVAAGFTTEYTGRLYLDDKPIHIPSSDQAKRLGIHYIEHQSMLIDRLTIEENILIAPGHSNAIIHRNESRLDIGRLFEALGMDFHPDEPVAQLTFYQKTMLEVARGVHSGARVIILDGVLNEFSLQMFDEFARLCEKLRAMGISLVLVDNGIRYLKPFCDRIFVMREGMTAGILENKNLSDETVVSVMLGYKVRADKGAQRSFLPRTDRMRPLLEWQHVHYKNMLHDVSFVVREGETFGLLNVNKQSGTAIKEVLTDARQPTRGKIIFDAKPLKYLTSEHTMRRGLAVLPDEGKVFANFTLEQNISIAAVRHHSRMGMFFNRRKLHYDAVELIDTFLRDMGSIGFEQNAVPDNRMLQRKVMLCRMLIARPKMIVMMHPTLNMDELMKDEVAKDIKRVHDRGVTMMLISTDVEFLLSVCDHVAIVNSGTVENDYIVTEETRTELLNQYGRYIREL